MTDDEIVGLSLVGVASAITDGKLSSTQVTQACLAKIERLDGEIDAIVTLDPDSALRDALRADDELAAGQVPPRAGDCERFPMENAAFLPDRGPFPPACC